MRTPVFELHIRPMFSRMDRESMMPQFDLWEYEDVVNEADDIAARIAVDMPPLDCGGPWPDEWVQLFQRWMFTGFKRLAFGAAQYTWSQSARATSIRATGTFPAAGFKGWLQLEVENDSSKTYVLYFEAPDVPPGGTPTDFNLLTRYGPTDNRSVFIRDSTGVKQIH